MGKSRGAYTRHEDKARLPSNVCDHSRRHHDNCKNLRVHVNPSSRTKERSEILTKIQFQQKARDVPLARAFRGRISGA